MFFFWMLLLRIITYVSFFPLGDRILRYIIQSYCGFNDPIKYSIQGPLNFWYNVFFLQMKYWTPLAECDNLWEKKAEVGMITLILSVYTNQKTDEWGRWPSVFCLHLFKQNSGKLQISVKAPPPSPLDPLHIGDFNIFSQNWTEYSHKPLLPPTSCSVLLTLNLPQTNFRQWHLIHPLKYLRPHKCYIKKVYIAILVQPSQGSQKKLYISTKQPTYILRWSSKSDVC